MNKQALVSPFTTVGGVDPDQKYIDVRMNAIKRKILIVSGKGGKKVCVDFLKCKRSRKVKHSCWIIYGSCTALWRKEGTS